MFKTFFQDAGELLTHPLDNDYDPLIIGLVFAVIVVFALWAFDSVNMVRRIKEGIAQ